MIFGMGIVYGTFAFVRSMTIQYYSLKSSKKTHGEMIDRIIKAPINTFYDVTPVGRILNRFSKDLTVMDTELSWYFSSGLVSFYSIIGTIALSVVAI